ncbi:hypothetical protein SAMN05192583_1406 [Sphingomonas gellani]|uniref:Uncharacterized protein n=1 Tax=Sphingomonas gellani TaxID=1166340 RepID=A0A1H8C0U6_9SPHN|nr:phage regulatory CII family protein [Sphingomonas gellani]SEM88663.1 hypothetical protein SAMN05192583_1406 [Sphingomonas gellani]
MNALIAAAVKGRMLKIAFGELVARAGGVEAAAGFCRVGKSTLARYYALGPADEECFAPVDVVRDLEALVGEPMVTRVLVTMAEGIFLPQPTAPARRGDLLSMLADAAKEHSDLTQKLCASLADGHLDAVEAERVLAEIDDNFRVLATMRAAVTSILEGQ